MASRHDRSPKSRKSNARKAIQNSLSSSNKKTKTNRTASRRDSRRRSLTKSSSSIDNLNLRNVPSLERMTSANYKNAVVKTQLRQRSQDSNNSLSGVAGINNNVVGPTVVPEKSKKVTERSEISDALMFFLTRGGESPPSHGRYFNTDEATRILMLPAYRDETRRIMSGKKESPQVPIYEIGKELYRHFAESQAKEHENKMTPDISVNGHECLSKCMRTMTNRKCHCETKPYKSWGRNYDWDLCDESKCPDRQTGFSKKKRTQKKRPTHKKRPTQKKRKSRSTRKR